MFTGGAAAFGRTPQNTDAVAVVGACVPERREYARRLAAARRLTLVPAKQMEAPSEALSTALGLNAWLPDSTGLLLEYPTKTPARDIVGELTDEETGTSLRELVCVVDAAHLLTDLSSPELIPVDRDEDDGSFVMAPRAELIVTQIEFASTVVLTNCHRLGADERHLLRALVSHLSPQARVEQIDSTRSAQYPTHTEPFPPEAYTREQTRPGWITLLNGEFAPAHSHSRVSALRYEQPRPFHPQRLADLLATRDSRSSGELLLRSVGFCHVCSRPHVTAQWNQVGDTLSLAPAAIDHQLTAEDEPLAFGQDLAFIGLDLDPESLIRDLDAATLTDAELLAGPQVWATFRDPFPAWHGVGG
ncbi:GTP-binding protein [Brevibacterium album]|uniref:GTP-binding protein n=1 Tax=Brevibacterium album TaxID=417948 RepID=UPI000407A3B0|nr:GTP-binding protein [Brevibacterium album]